MKVSIITATWNSESTIEDTILSVVRQTYQNYEHIIIDGNSSDRTLSIIKNIGNEKIKIISENDNGIYDALNKGINNAKGDVIGFLHSDDIFYDDSVIKNMVDTFRNTNCNAVYGNLEYVDKNNIHKVIRYWKSKDFNKKSVLRGWMPPHTTFYMDKDSYLKHGNFDLNYKISSDYESMLRYILNGNINCQYIDKTLIKMRVGGASNKNFKSIVTKTKEDISIMKKFYINPVRGILYKNFSKIRQFILSS
jgi:glycosyltransferase